MSVTACGKDGADPDTVQARLEATLPPLVDASAGALAFAGDSEALGGLGRSLDSLDAAFGLGLAFDTGDDELEPLPAADGDDELDGAAFAQQLGELLFNSANYEGDGIYRIPAALMCPEDFDTGASDPECIDMVAAAELRIRVEDVGGGLDFTLLVGPDRDEPIAVELRDDRVTVASDLAEARSALSFLATLSGEDLELPAVMEGELAASLKVLGTQHVALELAARTAVRIEGAIDGDAVAFATAAKDPLIGVEVDGVAGSLGGRLDLGRTTVSAPWSMIDDASLAVGDFHLDWAGLSGRATVAAGDQSLTIEDIGFGDASSTIKLDDVTLFALDFNAASGRRMDLTIAPTADGLPSFALSPGMELALTFHLAPLAAAGDLIESHLLDETYTLGFTGQGPMAQPIEPSLDGSFAGGLAILGGQLSIASSAAADAVVAAAGQCLVADEVVSGEHPILGAFAVTDCP